MLYKTMKHRLLPLALLALFIGFIGLLAQPAQAQLGIAAGLNYDDLSDLDTGSAETSFDNASGYHIGLFYDLAVGPLALRPGVYYMDIGEFEDAEGIFNEGIDLSLIEVPVDVRLRLAPTPVLTPYLMGGPVFRFPSAESEDFEEVLEEVNIAGNVGAGLELSVPGLGLRLYPEVRYTFGLSNFTRDEFEVGGQNFTVEEEGRLNTFILRLGVAF